MTQNRVEDLLVEWELARRGGKELSVSELCAAAPELLGELQRQIQVLKATSWMIEDVNDGPEEDDQPSSSVQPKPDTVRESDVTTSEFVDLVTDSGILADAEVDQIRREYVPAAKSARADDLALKLVEDGILTAYQVAVLLEREDGPLLLDRYIILDTLGSGGMGLVFKALHRSMERIVALKVLPRHAVDSLDKIRRFRREIKAAAQLSHPNIVTAYDAHESNGTYFLVMEYVSGTDLRQIVDEQGPMAVEDAVRIGIQIASALATAHRQDIVHRDIKPANILLSTSGEAKLLDLGLARIKLVKQDVGYSEITRDGLAMGTVAFMSPEQALDSKRADVRSDIYSLGCTLYYLLVGKAPFERDTAVQTIVAHREEAAPSLCDARDNVPANLDNVYRTMVAKSPDNRQQTMDEVQSELLACGTIASEIPNKQGSPGSRVTSYPSDLPPRRRRSNWRLPLAIAGALAVFALMIVAGVQLWIAAGNAIFAQRDAIVTQRDVTLTQQDIAKWVLNLGGAIEAETQLGPQQMFDVAELPDGPMQIVGVDLTATVPTSLEPLESLEQLQWLYVDNFAIDKTVLAKLTQVKQLTDLELANCSIDDEDLAKIASMSWLQSLAVDGNAITDRGVVHLAHLPMLHTLYLGATQITDEGVANVLPLTSLEHLDLSETKVTAQGIRSLSKLPNLMSLDLTTMPISGQQIQSLTELGELQELCLDYSTISREAITQLANLRRIDTLYLQETNLDDTGMRQVAELDQLRHLDISGTEVTDSGLREISKLPKLRELALADMELSDEGMGVIASLKQLRSLDLTGTNIGDAELRKLTDLNRLRTLTLDRTNVSDAGVDRFQTKCPNCAVFWNMYEFPPIR